MTMTGPTRQLRRLTRRAGFTLVEAAISIAIVGGLVVAGLYALGAGSRPSPRLARRGGKYACVNLHRGKFFRNNAKLFFSAGWVVGYIIVHASRRRLSDRFPHSCKWFQMAPLSGSAGGCDFQIERNFTMKNYAPADIRNFAVVGHVVDVAGQEQQGLQRLRITCRGQSRRTREL